MDTVQGPFFSAVTIDILLLSFLIESNHNDLAKVLFVRVPWSSLSGCTLNNIWQRCLVLVVRVCSGSPHRFSSSWA
jgi:hypothetical protein